MSTKTTGYTALIDYYIHSDGTATFHGVDYSAQKDRICHRTFKITHIPFAVHLGPFASDKDSLHLAGMIREHITNKLPELHRGEMSIQVSPRTTDDTNWRGVPIAYLSNPINPARHWLEIEVLYNDEESLFCYSHHHSLLRTYCKQLLAEDPRRFPDAKWWQTDRNSQDSLLRLLAPYTIPGIFMQQHTPMPTRAAIAKGDDITHLKWKHFRDLILTSQPDDDNNALTFERGKGEHNTHDARFDAKLLVAATSIRLESVVFYEINLHTGECKKTMSKSVALYNEEEYLKELKTSGLSPDLLIVGIPQDYIDQVHAKLNREAISKGKNEAIISLIRSHCDVIVNARTLKLLQGVPADIITYKHCPYIVTPNFDKLHNSNYIYEFVSQLFTKARITGRTLGFLSAPMGYSALSRRAEGTITRTFLRAGYTVLPVSSHTTYTRDDEDDKDAMDEDHVDIILEGGINADVDAQFVCEPNMIVNLDFNSFYGAIISIFELDPCNPHLWVTFDTEMRKLPASTKPAAAAATTDEPRLPTRVDISPIGDIWYSEMIGNGIVPANERPETTARRTNNLPLASYLQKCLLMRRVLQAQLEHPTSSNDKGRNTTKALIDFLKSIVSAAYGAIGYVNNRFHLVPLSALVTQYGRRIIRESSERMKKLAPRSAKEIMCVTDSLALRFNMAELPLMLKAIEELRQNYIQHYYGEMLQLTMVQVSRLLMTKRNHYAYLEKGSEDRIVVKGFSPRHKDTPRYIVRALESILATFMQKYAKNIWLDDSHTHEFVPAHDQEKFVQTLQSSVAAACKQGLLSCDPPSFSSITVNKTLGDYFVKLSKGDAQRRHFMYSDAAKKSCTVETAEMLGLVQGCVIDYDKMRGYMVSPVHEISKSAWDSFYLDYSIRKELINILQTFFPVIAIDDAVCGIIGLEHLTDWNGRSVAILASGNHSRGITAASVASLLPKVAESYWEKVAAMAYGDGQRENEIVLIEQERIPGVVEEALPVSSSSSQLSEEDLLGGISDDALLELDIDSMVISNPRVQEVATTAATIPKKKKKKPAKPTAPKPIKRVLTNEIPEFVWKFELSCATCKKSTRSASIKLASDYICYNCGHSIFGDFMQTESAETNSEAPPSIRLECYCKETGAEYDFMNPEQSFIDTRCNWRSLDALKSTLLTACMQETTYVPGGKDDGVPKGDEGSDSLLLAPADLQAKALFINFTDLNGNFEDQPTTNLKYLGLVFKHLSTHPYLQSFSNM